MKNILLFLLFATTLSTYASKVAVILKPAQPEAGEVMSFAYEGKLAKEGTRISVIFCYDSNYRMLIKALSTKFSDGKIVGSIMIPDSVSFFYLKVSNKSEIDNNEGNGYGFNVYQNGSLKKGTFFSQAFSIFSNKWFFNGNIDPEKANELVEKEYAQNPDMKLATRPFYVGILSDIPSRKVEAVALAKKYFDEIMQTGLNEKDASRYANIISNGKYNVRDSLKTLVIKKYPTGFTAFNRKLSMIDRFAVSDPDSAFIIYNNIRRDFPDLTREQLNCLKISMLSAFASKKDYSNLEKQIDEFMVEGRTSIDMVTFAEKCDYLAREMYEADENLGQAKEIAKKAIIAHQLYDSLTVYYANALDTYAAILYKLRDIKGAIKNQRKAVSLYDNLEINFNQFLIKYLIDDRQFQEAMDKSEELISQNLSSPGIDSLYQAAYIAQKGTKDGFEEIFRKVREKNDIAYFESLNQKLISAEAPEFILKDLDGRTVKLSDFRGSIVILDFWATWCAPCVGAFPAMKKAMNELKDKPVKFLFIDTLEEGNANKKNEKVKRTLVSRHVSDFHVLLDEEKNLNYVAHTAYSVPSIPAKYIIDQNGKIRYKSTGFSTDDKLVRELTSVVKMISK